MTWGRTLNRLISQRALTRSILLAAASLSATGCTVLESSEDTCLNLGICTETDPLQPLPEAWACLEETFPPPNLQAESPTATYTTAVIDFSNPAAPLENVVLQACATNDGPCATPIATGQPIPDTVPPVYQIQVPVQPLPFTGYFRFTADDHLESNVFIPLVADFQSQIPVQLVRTQQAREFAADLSIPNPDSITDGGILAVNVLGCPFDDGAGGVQQAPGAGARLVAEQQTEDSDELSWAIVNGFPVRDARSGGALNELGVAGLALLPDSASNFCAEVAGRRFGNTTLRVRAGRLSATFMTPTVGCSF